MKRTPREPQFSVVCCTVSSWAARHRAFGRRAGSGTTCTPHQVQAYVPFRRILFMVDPPRSPLLTDPHALLGTNLAPAHRELQLAEISSCFAGPLAKVRPLHAWIHGPPGSGKTFCVSHVLKHDVPPAAAVPVLVNCRERFTFLSTIEAILDVLKPLRSPQRTKERQLAILQQELTGRSAVIALDEVDCLPPAEMAELLHALAPLPKTSVLCIASSRMPLLELPEATRSRLAPRQILFPRYLPDEIATIVTSVAHRALAEGAWTKEAIERIADESYGDARRALALLKHAVQRALETGSPQLLPAHLVPGNFSHSHPKAEDLLAILSTHERLIFDLVSVRGPIPGPDLEQGYVVECSRRGIQPVASRTVNKYLAFLCQSGLLVREHGAGTSGWVYRAQRLSSA